MHWCSQFIRGQCIRLSMLFVADNTQAFVRATNNMKYYITIVWSPLLTLFPVGVLHCVPFTLTSILCFIFLLFLYCICICICICIFIVFLLLFLLIFTHCFFCIFEALTLVAVWRFWLFFQIKFTTFWSVSEDLLVLSNQVYNILKVFPNISLQSFDLVA